MITMMGLLVEQYSIGLILDNAPTALGQTLSNQACGFTLDLHPRK